MRPGQYVFCILLTTVACLTAGCSKSIETRPEVAASATDYYLPQVHLGALFKDVQLAGLFEDSKTFPDYIPRFRPDSIAGLYLRSKDAPNFDLAAFIDRYFQAPRVWSTIKSYELPDSMHHFIPEFWENLVREPSTDTSVSSLISLPKPFIVPGGRFREVYYWDCYFTMLGLGASDRWDLVENMLDNFAYLIDTIGFIPNGNRTYYLGRSQPPFFSSMVMFYAKAKGMSSALEYLPQIEKEYAFWMEGADLLIPEQAEYKRVVMLDGGLVLNRYWDEYPEPRPESYREDFMLALELDSGESKPDLYRNIRAGCESGWDFSTRWLDDASSLASIVTTHILPIDLNCLILHMESTIGLLHEASGNQVIADNYLTKANIRAAAIRDLFWDSETGFYQDYNFKENEFTGVLSLAGLFPFFFEIAERDQAVSAAELLEEKFLFDGGLVTTLNKSGHQWDYPNGWAPLQWISVVGLDNYEQEDLAIKVAERWVNLNRRVFQEKRRMMEKYNVVEIHLEAGGGEYPGQDGFGWTNGVAQALMISLESIAPHEAPGVAAQLENPATKPTQY